MLFIFIFKVLSLEHPENAWSLIVIFSDTVTVSRLVQLRNALALIFFILSGMNTFVKLLHPENARSPILTTV